MLGFQYVKIVQKPVYLLGVLNKISHRLKIVTLSNLDGPLMASKFWKNDINSFSGGIKNRILDILKKISSPVKTLKKASFSSGPLRVLVIRTTVQLCKYQRRN